MKVLNIFENSCTDRAREHIIYYFCDGEYFVITRDSKNEYRENLTKLFNIQSVIDFIVNLVNEGNKLDIESGTDRDEYHDIIDESVIMDFDSYTYDIIEDIDELIDYCKK